MLPHVPLNTGESLVSWAARAAQVQTRAGLVQLSNFVDMDRSNFLCPEMGALAKVGDLFGGHPDELQGAAFVWQADGMVRHRSEIFRADFLSWRNKVFCPHCIQADEQVYGRAHWHLETGLTCFTHQISLIRSALPDPDQIFALPSKFYPSGRDLDQHCDGSTPQAASPLQAYVENRLAGAAGPAWMDRQRIDQAARAARMLGSVILHGPGFRNEAMAGAQANDADSIGYDYLASGADGVRIGLEDVLRGSRSLRRDSSPQIAFGSFFRWLERTTDAGPIRGLFIEFAMDNFALDGGTDLLGTALPARRNHSVASLAAGFGLSRHMVSAAAKLVGLLPEGTTNNSAFDVAPGEAIAKELKASIPASSVASYLGCDANTAAAIVADGHATRILAEFPRSDSQCSNAIKRVTTASLDDLLAKMFDLAAPIDGVSLYVEPIGKAAKHLNWQVDRVIRLALKQKVPLYRLRGRNDFGALCVDRQDFRWILSAPPLFPCLSKKKAAAELGVDVHTVDLLMRAARPDGTPLLRRVQPMSGKERDRWHVYEDDFTEFQASHVALVKLAEESQATPSEMASTLAARGIHPINVSTSSSYRFYRRSEL